MALNRFVCIGEEVRSEVVPFQINPLLYISPLTPALSWNGHLCMASLIRILIFLLLFCCTPCCSFLHSVPKFPAFRTFEISLIFLGPLTFVIFSSTVSLLRFQEQYDKTVSAQLTIKLSQIFLEDSIPRVGFMSRGTGGSILGEDP